MSDDYSPQIGAVTTFTRQISEADTALFLLVTRDESALSEEPGPLAPRPREAAPFALLAALLATAAARHTAQPELARFQHEEIRFSAPAYTDDTLSAVARLIAYDAASQTIQVQVECDNQEGLRLADGVFALHVD